MPNGARSSSSIFFSRACGAWSVAMQSMVPSTSPSMIASTSAAVRSGGLILKLESKPRRLSSVSVKWCGQASAVTRMPRRFASRIRATPPPVETCMAWSRPPVTSARAMSRPISTSSAAAGIPPRPSTSETSPSCITPPRESSSTSSCARIGLSNIRQYSKARRISSAS